MEGGSVIVAWKSVTSCRKGKMLTLINDDEDEDDINYII